MKKFNLDIFTAKLAIGSIWIVSIFLIMCGFKNLFPLVEGLTKTTTWEVIVAIPLIAFSYTLGAIIVNLSRPFTFTKNHQEYCKNEIAVFLKLSKLKNEYIMSRYVTIKQQIEFFRSFIPTVIVFAGAVLWSSRLLLSEKFVVRILALATLLFTPPPLFHIVNRLRKEVEILVKESVRITEEDI